jgi:hypothetical protein
MTTREWKALERMVKGKDPMIINSKDGKVMLEYNPFGAMERYDLTLPYGVTSLYEHSGLSSQVRTYLKEVYDVWYEWERMTL